MNSDFMRFIDRHLGRMLCLILTGIRRILDLFTKKESGGYQKILFIKLIEQGSTILAYPAMKAAEIKAGRENIYFVVLKENKPILDVLDIVPEENIFVIDSSNLFVFTISFFAALAGMRKAGIDASVDLEFFSRISAIISYLSGAKKRAGLCNYTSEGPYRGSLLTHKLMYNPYLNTETMFSSLTASLDKDLPEGGNPMIFEKPENKYGLPQFSPGDKEKSEIAKKLRDKKSNAINGKIILLNPNASDLLPIRRWPDENFVKLGKMILDVYPDITIVITGTEKEITASERIASEIGNAVSMAGETNIRELLSLYCMADVLVTNDSGPAQFSRLTPIKAIILFGPETPVLYGGYDDGKIVLGNNLVCSPCVNVYNHRKSPCNIGTCLKSIKAEDVFEKVKSLI